MAENNINRRVLRRKSEFDNLKRSGRRYSPTKWLVLNYCKNTENHLRFGITISAKVGNSVMRNRLKRWVREYFRQIIQTEADRGIDINVVFKPVSAEFYRNLEHKEVDRSLDLYFKRA